MNRAGIFETLVGLVVVVVAAGFLFHSYSITGGSADVNKYGLQAVFGKVDGVSVGSEVRISGVKVGAVTKNELDPQTYEARVAFSVASGVGVPEDSIAKVVSDGLLGGAHISIEPGASDVMLQNGETITITQGSVDLLGLAVQAFTNNSSAAGPDAGGLNE